MTRMSPGQAMRFLKRAQLPLPQLNELLVEAGLAPPPEDDSPDSDQSTSAVLTDGPSRRAVKRLRMEWMLEAEDQMALFRWVDIYLPILPQLEWFHHVPNGGDRHPAVGAQLKRQGVRAGVADLDLPWPMPRMAGRGRDGSGWYHGLWIELKRAGGKKPEGAQAAFLKAVHRRGYKVVVAYGYLEAWHALEEYLLIDMPFSMVPDPRPRWPRTDLRWRPPNLEMAAEYFV